MAHDLVFKHSRLNWARDSHETASPASTSNQKKRALAVGALALLSAAIVIVPRLSRKIEIHRYRRSFSDNLATTQETPTISMHDLVYGKHHSE